MNNTIAQKILWFSTGLATISALMVAIESFADRKKQESKVPKEEVVTNGKEMECASLFTNTTNLVSEKEFEKFISKLKTRLNQKEKSVQQDVLACLFPEEAECDDPVNLLSSYNTIYCAVQSVEDGENPTSSGLRDAILCDISELYMWKMFFYRLKKAIRGERVLLLEDQKKWMAWREEHSQLIFEAAGEGSGRTWFENIALNEVGQDRLNELFCFEDFGTEIYRDLKFASVRCEGKDVPLKHGRLYFEQYGKKVIGRIINPAFCRRVILGRDIYKFAVLEPDYIIDIGHNCDEFSWACVWKNGKNTANYRLPIEKKVRHLPLFSEERKIESGIKSLSVSNADITIIPSIAGKPFAIDIKATNSECID